MTSAMTIQVDSLGAGLRYWRSSAGLTQRELARRISDYVPCSYGRVDRIEHDKAEPDLMTIAAWAMACGRKRGELPGVVADYLDRISDLSRMQWSLSPPCSPTAA